MIVPGFIDAGTGLGFGGNLSRVTISTKLGEQLAADDPAIQFARQGGVTTGVFVSSSSPSPMLAFKLGDVPRLLKEPIAIRFSMSTNLTTGVPGLKRTLTSAKAYADSWTKYEKDLAEYQTKLKAYQVELAKYEAAKRVADAKKAAEAKKAAAEKSAADKSKSSDEKKEDSKTASDKPKSDSSDEAKEKKDESKKPDDDKSKSSSSNSKTTTSKSTASDPKAPAKPTEPKKPRTSSTSEPYRALMAGKIPAVVEARSVNAIKAVVKLFREDFSIRLILANSPDVYRVPELLAKHDVELMLGPELVRSIDNKRINLPQIAANQQIGMAFRSGATTGAQQLPLAVQYAVFRGLSTEDALAGFTQSAANMLSLDQTIGSIEPGKDADLVVLSGPPFEPSSQVLAVMIDGIWVFEKGAE